MDVFDETKLLTIDELEQKRTIVEYLNWYDSKLLQLHRLSDDESINDWILLRKGLANRLYGEAMPFYYFLKHYYPDDNHAVVQLTGSAHIPYDAVICSEAGEIRFEITGASYDYQENLRMEKFIQDGVVSAIGKVSAKGTKRRGRTIDVEDGLVKNYTDKVCGDILVAVERKTSKKMTNQKYDASTMLLVGFDNGSVFERQEPKIYNLRNYDIVMNNLCFSKIYLVGYARGKVFEVK